MRRATTLLIAALAVAGCGKAPAATTKPTLNASRHAAAPAPTPPSRDIAVTLRAVQRALHTDAECAALGARAHVATVTQPYSSLFGSGTLCWREVHAGDSAYATASTLSILVPAHAAGTAVNLSFPARITTKSAASCIAGARAGHRAAVVIGGPHHIANARYATCIAAHAPTGDSSDDTAGDATPYSVRIPAAEVR